MRHDGLGRALESGVVGVREGPAPRLEEGARASHQVFGRPGGETGPDDDFTARGVENIGASILGRNMFGPVRGSWPADSWKGWRGEEPPYYSDVFVLTHHERAPPAHEGRHHVPLRDAGHSRDVRLGGGVATIRQYLRAGLVDELHLATSPVLLGRGEHLLSGIDLLALGNQIARHANTPAANHVVLMKS